jgi:putative protease
MKKPELLSPAGDMEKLEFALRYGADAVYLAGTRFGMRAASNNFADGELPRAISLAHERGKRVYVTCNILPGNADIEQIPAFLEFIGNAGADAVIVADLGVLGLAQKHAPKLKYHLSTQVSVSNHIAAQSWFDMGIDRIVLARELSLDDIAEIRAKTNPRLELEAFVHGAMCMSYSGRCLLSSFMTGRGANMGSCAQPCRWKYTVVEEKRPGQHFEIREDETGSYILNAKDLCMVSHIPALVRAGLDSFKIEGRVKSAYYCAVVTNAYRAAIDSYFKAPDEFNPDGFWADEVLKVSHREYCTGFFFGDIAGQHTADSDYIRAWDIVAVVRECDDNGNAAAQLKNRIFSGDVLELLQPGKIPVCFTADGFFATDGARLDMINKPMEIFNIKLPCRAAPGSILRRRAAE